MVNRGEEKVRVHMNVVPRSTMNTNGGTENGTRKWHILFTPGVKSRWIYCRDVMQLSMELITQVHLIKKM